MAMNAGVMEMVEFELLRQSWLSQISMSVFTVFTVFGVLF